MNDGVESTAVKNTVNALNDVVEATEKSLEHGGSKEAAKKQLGKVDETLNALAGGKEPADLEVDK